MNPDRSSKEQGFTIIELIMAMAITLVVMATVFSTFKSQQDSYVVQSQISATQQNLRAALFMISRDIQMAGYYTNFVKDQYTFGSTAPADTVINGATIRPVIYSINNAGITGVKGGTDVIVIIKVDDDNRRELDATEYADPGGAGVINCNINNQSALDLTYSSASGHNKYGILVKKNMNRAELFEVNSDNYFESPSGLVNNYAVGDTVAKVDVIIYKIEDTTEGPTLKRINLGTNAEYTTIAENVDNLQFSYIKNDGSEIFNLNNSADIPLVRAVKVNILAKTNNKIRGYTDPNTYQVADMPTPVLANDGYMRRQLTSTVNTRNIGL